MFIYICAKNSYNGNVQLVFHCNSGYANALQCNVVRIFSVLLHHRRIVFSAQYELNI